MQIIIHLLLLCGVERDTSTACRGGLWCLLLYNYSIKARLLTKLGMQILYFSVLDEVVRHSVYFTDKHFELWKKANILIHFLYPLYSLDFCLRRIDEPMYWLTNLVRPTSPLSVIQSSCNFKHLSISADTKQLIHKKFKTRPKGNLRYVPVR